MQTMKNSVQFSPEGTTFKEEKRIGRKRSARNQEKG